MRDSEALHNHLTCAVCKAPRIITVLPKHLPSCAEIRLCDALHCCHIPLQERLTGGGSHPMAFAELQKSQELVKNVLGRDQGLAIPAHPIYRSRVIWIAAHEVRKPGARIY